MLFKGKYPGGNLDASKEKGSKEKEALTSSEKMLATSLKSLTASREKHLPRGFLLPAKVRSLLPHHGLKIKLIQNALCRKLGHARNASKGFVAYSCSAKWRTTK
jgi:hypothetical protein